MMVTSGASIRDRDGNIRTLKVSLDWNDFLRLAAEERLEGWKLKEVPGIDGENRVTVARRTTGGTEEIPLVEAYRLLQRWADRYLAWTLVQADLVSREEAKAMLGQGGPRGEVAD